MKPWIVSVTMIAMEPPKQMMEMAMTRTSTMMASKVPTVMPRTLNVSGRPSR